MNTDTLITATDLVVGYTDRPVCSPLTFTVQQGQMLACIGPNGAGKSTLLRTLTGILPPLDGQCTLMGQRPDPRRSWQRAGLATDMSMAAFFPGLTVSEHLMMVCLGHGVNDPEQVVEASLEDFGLETVRDSVPDHLSSGQRSRLALAAVFCRPRSLIILDEPESRLDVQAREDLGERLRDEYECGGGGFIVSHDPALVSVMATAVLVIDEHPRVVSVDEGVHIMRTGLV